MKKIKTTLIDTTSEIDLEYVNECLEINGCEPIESTDDSRYWDKVSSIRETEIEDFWDNIKYDKKWGKDCYCPVVVCGSCGLWYGRRGIEPKTFRNLYDALCACSKEAYDLIVRQVCSTIRVTNMHHDGNNYFDIHFLNNRGIDAKDRIEYGYGNADLSNRIYHKTLTDYLW